MGSNSLSVIDICLKEKERKSRSEIKRDKKRERERETEKERERERERWFELLFFRESELIENSPLFPICSKLG